MAYPAGDGFEDDITPDEPQAPAAPAPVRPDTPPPPSADPSGITPDPITPDKPADTVAPWRRLAAMAIRGGSNIAGRVLGGTVGGVIMTPTDVVTGPAGTIGGAYAGQAIGGGLGSAAGEWLAEKVEGRKDVNPYEVAGEAALGAIPIPGASSASTAVRLARAAGIGSALSAGDTAIRRLGQAAHGDDVDLSTLPDEMGRSAGWGAIGGTALEGLTSAIRARLTGEPPPAAPVARQAPIEGGGPVPLYPDLPAPAGKVTRYGQIQGLDPKQFPNLREGPPAPPVTPSVTPPAGPTDVFDAIRQLETEGGPTFNTPNQIATRAFESAPPRGTSTIATGNPELDRLLGGSGPPEPLDLPTRDVEGTEHYDVTPPELKQAGLDLSGTSHQGDLGPVRESGPGPVEDPDLPPEPAPVVNNGSGAPGGGGLEEQARVASMQANGRTRVKYNAGGGRTVLGNGIGSQDIFPGPGESTGIEDADGFHLMDDNGGLTPPSTPMRASITSALPPALRDVVESQIRPGETFDLGGAHAEELSEPPPLPGGGDADLWASMPPEMRDLYEKIQPAWAEHGAMEDRGLFGAPYQSNKFRESPEEFASRIEYEDPKMLMSGERKVRQILDAMKDEAGGASVPAMVHLAGAGVGGLAGAALDPEHPLKGGLEGAAAGLGVTMAIAHPETAEKLRYFGLFASPMTVIRKGLGDVGSAVDAAASHAFAGDLDTAKSILSNVFSKGTAQAAINHFRNSDISTSVGETVGPTADRILGAPSRAMGSITEALKDAYARAGLSEDDAKALTFSGEPTSAAGRAVVNAQREGGPLVRLLMPTAKTIVNIAERNFQALPGVGALPLITKLARGEDVTAGEWGSTAGKQAMGLLIGALGYARGSASATDKTTGSPSYTDQALRALIVPYMMAEAAGEAVGHAMYGRQDPHKLPGQVALSQAKAAILRDLPVPTGADFNPEQWAAEFVPSGLRPLSTYAPNQYEQPDVLDPLIAKIPMLNDILLRPKRSALRGPQ